MAEDLTPKILQKYDSAELQMGDTARETTVVRYRLGKFGPFTVTFDRAPTEQQLREEFEKRRQTLQAFV